MNVTDSWDLDPQKRINKLEATVARLTAEAAAEDRAQVRIEAALRICKRNWNMQICRQIANALEGQ